MGQSCSCQDPSPFLTEYFQALQDDPDNMEGLHEIIEHAFNQYDKDEDGVLDPDESHAFFEDYVNRFVAVCSAKQEKAVDDNKDAGDEAIASGLEADKMLRGAATGGVQIAHGLDPRQRVDVAKVGGEHTRNKKEQVRAHWSEMYSEWISHYDAGPPPGFVSCDHFLEAAFEALDVNQNGHIELDEMIDALTPNSAKSKELLEALGMTQMLADSGVGELGLYDAAVLGSWALSAAFPN